MESLLDRLAGVGAGVGRWTSVSVDPGGDQGRIG